jgi:hypothetical protein
MRAGSRFSLQLRSCLSGFHSGRVGWFLAPGSSGASTPSTFPSVGRRPDFANLLDGVETFVTLTSERMQLLCIIAICESGGIGRRTRLRIWRGNPWGFESPLSHQLPEILRKLRSGFRLRAPPFGKLRVTPAERLNLGSGGETHGGSSPPFRTTYPEIPWFEQRRARCSFLKSAQCNESSCL